MDKVLFDMKFTAKTLAREAAKSKKKQTEYEKKCADYMGKDEVAMAQINASNAIREKNQCLNLTRLASRIDAVGARVEIAVRMNQVTKSLAAVTDGMAKVLGSADPTDIARMMDQFERQFENLDVRSAALEGAMASTTATTTPEDEVQAYMAQLARAHQMSFADALATAKPGTVTSFSSLAAPAAPARVAVDATGAGGPKPPTGPAGGPDAGASGAGGAASAGGSSRLDSFQARLEALRKQ